MGENAASVVGGILTATGFGAPLGIGLIAADQAGAFDAPEIPKPKDPFGREEDEAAARAAERERARTGGTRENLAGSASQALSAAIGKQKLGGTS